MKLKKRHKEVDAIFKEKGWKYSIEIDPDKPENVNDLEMLLNPPKTRIAEKKVGRNEPCPCGSGQKHKKCCGQ